MEAQLLQSQKLETLGTLAGGIAHDFNNILQSIQGFTSMVMDNLPVDSEDYKDLLQVLKGTNRAKEMTQQLLTFSRQEKPQKKIIQFGEIVREALTLLHCSLPSTIEIRQKYDTENDSILADSTQMHQVVMNICANASHAMHENGGLINVSLEKVHYARNRMPTHLKNLSSNSGDYLRLSIKDTGKGMDKQTLKRVFEPFFTTNKVGEGTGLGLAVVHGIVSAHDGEIVVKSTVGKGSDFQIYLPLHETKPKRVSKKSLKAEKAVQTYSILK